MALEKNGENVKDTQRWIRTPRLIGPFNIGDSQHRAQADKTNTRSSRVDTVRRISRISGISEPVSIRPLPRCYRPSNIYFHGFPIWVLALKRAQAHTSSECLHFFLVTVYFFHVKSISSDVIWSFPRLGAKKGSEVWDPLQYPGNRWHLFTVFTRTLAEFFSHVSLNFFSFFIF